MTDRRKTPWIGAVLTLALAVALLVGALVWGGTNRADCAERGGIYGRSPYGNSDVMVCVGPEGNILRTY